MLLRFLFLITFSFMTAFVVYFGHPDRGIMINAFDRIDADTALTGAMTSLLYLIAMLPFFFMGFWKGWKLGFIFLALAAFGPGVLALQAVGSAERAAQADDVAPSGKLAQIARIDLVENNGSQATTCKSVCRALLRRGVVETVRQLDSAGKPVSAFAIRAGGEIVGAAVEQAGDVKVTLFQDSDAKMRRIWPSWAGSFAEPKTLTRITIVRDGEVLLRQTSLSFERADMPTWLQPPQSGLGIGDLRASIDLAKVTEWHTAIAPDVVSDALMALGANDETLVARAREP